MTSPRYSTRSFEWFRFALALQVIVGALVVGDWLWRGDQVLYDMGLRLASRPPPPEVVIAAIDEASLAQIGRWPWPRGVEAELVRRLNAAGAKAIVLDILFAEPDHTDPQADRQLAAAIRDSGRVILPVVMEQARLSGLAKETLPIPELAAVATLGHAHIELDYDGIARRVYLKEGLGTPHWPHLALATAQFMGAAQADKLQAAHNSQPPSGSPLVWERDDAILIPYFGPPGHFPRISCQQILSGEFAPDTFRGKVVFVGVTAAGLGDALPTPLSGFGHAMPGVEIHANIYAALREGPGITQVSGAWCYLVSALLVLAPALWLPRLTPRRALLASAGLVLGTLVISLVLMRTQWLWFPPIAVLFTLATAYPLWSWRRLEYTLRYLDEELVRLRAEPGLVKAPEMSERRVDPLHARVLAVQGATARLRAMRRFIADSLAQMPDGVLVVDAQGAVALSNRQAARYLVADPARDLSGLSLQGLLSGLAINEPLDWSELCRRALAGDEAALAVQARHAGGWDILVHLAPLRMAEQHGQGKIAGLIANLSDISELKASERKRGELLGFLSHDLRSPLVSILALLELLRSGSNAVHLGRALDSIEQNARHTLNLAEDFVQLARAEALGGEQRQEVDMAAVASDALGQVWGRAVAKGVRLTSRLPETPLWVRGDPEMLARAVLNLLDNAVKYGPSSSAVVMTVAQQDGAVRCCVRDQGAGIAPQDIPRIFDRFQRLTQTGASRQTGVGLGLALVKTVMDHHGGRVEVHSKPGHGAEFCLVLPLVTVTEHDASPAV